LEFTEEWGRVLEEKPFAWGMAISWNYTTVTANLNFQRDLPKKTYSNIFKIN